MNYTEFEEGIRALLPGDVHGCTRDQILVQIRALVEDSLSNRHSLEQVACKNLNDSELLFACKHGGLTVNHSVVFAASWTLNEYDWYDEFMKDGGTREEAEERIGEAKEIMEDARKLLDDERTGIPIKNMKW